MNIEIQDKSIGQQYLDDIILCTIMHVENNLFYYLCIHVYLLYLYKLLFTFLRLLIIY